MWSASVPATAPGEFDAAVDACVTSPPYEDCAPEVKGQIDHARQAAKDLSTALTGDLGAGVEVGIGANLSGHACVEAGAQQEDGIQVQVAQVDLAQQGAPANDAVEAEPDAEAAAE